MARIINLQDREATALQTATDILGSSGLVAVPTETVYGLAANACDADAVAKIYAAKGRPSFNPLIAHVADRQMAERFGAFDANADMLASTFWPGPLTLVLPLRAGSGLAEAVTAGLDTVALRQPQGAMAKLAQRLGCPLAAPSANSSGQLSPTRADHVAKDLGGKVDLILDNGPCAVGLESTIVKCADGKVTLLREGGVSREEIETVVGPVAGPVSDKVEAPGMMLRHYAPTKPLRLEAENAQNGEALLGFGHEAENAVLNLSQSGDLEEAAQNLFAMLHELDQSDASGIAVQPIPKTGIGAAINDRLHRAAAGAAR